MSSRTASSHWGAFSAGSFSGGLGLNGRATFYAWRNFDNDETYLFLLADLGFGFSLGLRVNQHVRNLAKVLLGNKSLDDPSSYTQLTANTSFSASDLHFASGAEATAGVAVLAAGLSATSISAWPMFTGAPRGGSVNNDYFTAQTIYSTTDLGLSATAAYQFLGRWIKVWSF